jgi:hypothetical protein
MLRRLLYIFILLLLSARLSYANVTVFGKHRLVVSSCGHNHNSIFSETGFDTDTNRVKHPPQNRMDVLDHSTIKEVPKTKRQPKPEKIVVTAPVDTAANKNPRSKRRPEGVERPPDIIRRNNN